MTFKTPTELVSSKTFPKITLSLKDNGSIVWHLANGTKEQNIEIISKAIEYVKFTMVESIHKHGKQTDKNPKITLKMNLNNDNKIIWAFMNGSKHDYIDMLEHVLEYVNK